MIHVVDLEFTMKKFSLLLQKQEITTGNLKCQNLRGGCRRKKIHQFNFLFKNIFHSLQMKIPITEVMNKKY